MDVVFLPTFFSIPPPRSLLSGHRPKVIQDIQEKSQNRLPSPFPFNIKGIEERIQRMDIDRERGGEMRRVQSGPKEKKKKELALIQQQCAQDIESIHPGLGCLVYRLDSAAKRQEIIYKLTMMKQELLVSFGSS